MKKTKILVVFGIIIIIVLATIQVKLAIGKIDNNLTTTQAN